MAWFVSYAGIWSLLKSYNYTYVDLARHLLQYIISWRAKKCDRHAIRPFRALSHPRHTFSFDTHDQKNPSLLLPKDIFNIRISTFLKGWDNLTRNVSQGVLENEKKNGYYCDRGATEAIAETPWIRTTISIQTIRDKTYATKTTHNWTYWLIRHICRCLRIAKTSILGT